MIKQVVIALSSFLAFAPAMGQTQPTAGQPSCSADQVKAMLPSVGTAVNDWQEKSRVAVSSGVAEQFQMALCAAALELARERKVEPSSFDSAAGAAVGEHLDRMTDHKKQGRTLSAALRAQVGVSGVSRPTPKEYGVVVVDYRRTVETLSIGKQTLRPFPRLLVELGVKDIVGIAESRIVCSGRVTVVPERDVPFVC
jgi:hypothetical protein